MDMEPRFDTVCISAPYNSPWTAQSAAALHRAPNAFLHATKSDGVVKARLLEMPWQRRISVEASLPRLVYGSNRRGLPTEQVLPALEEAIDRAANLFVEFGYLSLGAFLCSRVDMTIDLQIPFGPDLAFHLAKVGFPRRLKNKHVCGGDSATYYSKHFVRGNPAPASSLCIYFKRAPVPYGSTRNLRCEPRLRTPHLRRLLGQSLPAIAIGDHAQELLRSSYDLLRGEFINLVPTSDHDARLAILGRSIRGKRGEYANRDLLDLWEFGQVVGLTELRKLNPYDDQTLMAAFRTIRRLGIGFGDPGNQSLVTFANVLKLPLSEQRTPY